MSDELICGFCASSLELLTLAQREDHYETHFMARDGLTPDDINVAESSQRSNNNMGERMKNRAQHSAREPWRRLAQKVKNDVFWYPSLGVPPPRNFTPGLIPILKHSLSMLCADGKVSQAVLCHAKVVHISKELWDASWGCGYRNFLMLCTGLIEQENQPLYRPLLDAPPAPSVRNLQSWIQAAWNDGFDVTGRKEMRNKIIGTNKWIGTAEIYTAFSHRGIAAELVDFNDFKDKESCAAAVLQWMVNYFTPDHPQGEKTGTSINDALDITTPVVITQLMPVILQHRGHSRLIVGYERGVDGTINLLTFDTGRLVRPKFDFHPHAHPHEPLSLLPQALRSSARSPYKLMDKDGHEQEDTKTFPRLEISDRQQNKPQKKPIVLTDLLTPSEREFAGDLMLEPENSANHPHKAGTNAKSKILSQLRTKGHTKGKGSHISISMKWRKTESDPHRVVNAFRLTAKQLARQTEYQVLYVPLRVPLTETEKPSRKIALGKRITGKLQSGMYRADL